MTNDNSNLDNSTVDDYYRRHLSEEAAGLYEQHDKESLRRKIKRKAGFKDTPGAPDKEVLNSVYAFLTGEFAVSPPYSLHRYDAPAFKPASRIRQMIADEIGWLIPEDPVGDSEKEGYPPFNRNGDQFTKYALAELCQEMIDRGDQREWMENLNEPKLGEEATEA